MSIITRPHTFLPGETADAIEVNEDFDLIYNEFNGNIDNENISDETITKDKLTQALQDLLVPAGVITMWSGGMGDIPAGWALCDGNNGTPDLRDKFIVGAGDDYSVGDTGGENNVELTESEIPSHDHGDGSLSTGNKSHSHSGTTESDTHNHSFNRGMSESGKDYDSGAVYSFSTFNTSSETHSHGFSTGIDRHNHPISGSTANAGGGNSHENRPPYFALAYIMKVQ